MAPARPFWKGYLKLSLVSCPIAMFPASSSRKRVSFRQINKNTGHRLKQQLVDSVSGEVVDSQDKGRGYEIGKNEYMPVEDEELDNLALESTHTIDIEKFVPRSKIDERYRSLHFIRLRSAARRSRHRAAATRCAGSPTTRPTITIPSSNSRASARTAS